ncbi:MAG: hypothetical protein ACJ73D_02755 [Pyrinomonadaceae bacterium]
MIRSRNQNSLLAVATLGVYLGLILAGATPSVLAQAATAKQFSVKDEVGREDNLDKKPDRAADDTTRAVEEYFRGAYFFVQDLKKIPGVGAESLDFEATILSPCPVTGFYDITGPKLAVSKKLEALIDLARSRASDSDGFAACLPSTQFAASNRVEARKLIFHLRNDAQSLKYELSIIRRDSADALRLFENLRTAVHALDSSPDDVIQAALLENTIFSAADNEVTITTRLPRGSLDTLLASNAK